MERGFFSVHAFSMSLSVHTAHSAPSSAYAMSFSRASWQLVAVNGRAVILASL